MPRAVVLTALPVEYLAVRKFLTGLCEVVSSQGTVYEQGVFAGDGFDWEVGIAEVGAGNAGAAIEAERAIGYFKPEVLLFVGIAGGLKDDVKIGDVVAATKVYGYESGKVAAEGFLTRPALGQSAFALVQRARAEAKKEDWWRRGEVVGRPQAVVGAIAAGDKVLADTDSEIFKLLRSAYNDAIAVEMEGFGFLSAAFAYPSIRAIVVRGISDMVAGKNDARVGGKEKNRHQKAANHAGAFAFELLAKLTLTEGASNEGQIQYNVAGDYVLGDKVMGDKISGDRSVSIDSAVQDAVIITGDRNQVVFGGGKLPENQAASGSRRRFYESQLEQKEQDLEMVQRDLTLPQTAVNQRRLTNQAEQLLTEIESLEKRLNQLLSE